MTQQYLLEKSNNMYQIVAIGLDNEMDLILAHKRSMKIAELCGLPLASQTRFSTAVSEIARCSITNGKKSMLQLAIRVTKPTKKDIVAIITDTVDLKDCNPEAFAYASRISGNIEYSLENGVYSTLLSQAIASPGLISDTRIKGFKDYFTFEPPLSPYDEIRKKNLELIALSEKLGESENKYRQLTNTLPLLIYTVDDRNRIELSNKWTGKYLDTALTMFDKSGLSPMIHTEDIDALLQGWEKAKTAKSGYHGQVRVKHRNSYFWHMVSLVPDKSDDGSVDSWILFFADIDAQKRIEETLKDNTELKKIRSELEKTNTELSFKNEELEQFAFVASHDLQEPLRKIMIMLSRAGENLSEEGKRELYFDKMGKAAERMSNLISDVLHYSRVNNVGHGMLPVDLNTIVTESLHDLDFVIQDKKADITVSDLPIVTGVAPQMRQLFFNLLNNALKFNSVVPVISITAENAASAQLQDGSTVTGPFYKVCIEDNGIGMDDQYSSKIFNMFQRLHHRDTYGGNGIGLALCRRIVENHKGHITFKSAPNKGTTFCIYLPNPESAIG